MYLHFNINMFMNVNIPIDTIDECDTFESVVSIGN